MKTKLYHNFSLITLVTGVFLLYSCTCKDASQKDKEANQLTTQDVSSQKPEGDIWACFFDCGNFGAQWGQAKILTMASDATNGEYEVEFKYNTHATAPCSKKWAKHVILKWHRLADISELKPGMVVLSGGDGTSYLAVVKEVFAYKGTVVVERFFNPGSKTYTDTWDADKLGAVKIIEEPVMTDPRIK